MVHSCSPKITSSFVNSLPPLDYQEEVVVIPENGEVPPDLVEIGTIKVGDTGFTVDCDYETVLNALKLEARKHGGNVVKITSHQLPGYMGSSCHRLSGTVYRAEDPSSLAELVIPEEEKSDNPFAELYIYRPTSTGFMVSYDLYLDDSVIYRVGSRSRTKVRIFKEGNATLWAKTESKATLPIDLEHGREYYIQCDLGIGIMVGRPILNLVPPAAGRKAYAEMKREPDTQDMILMKDGKVILCEITGEDDDTIYMEVDYKGNQVDTEVKKDEVKLIDYAE